MSLILGYGLDDLQGCARGKLADESPAVIRTMDEKFTFETTVSYGDVDRQERLLLESAFKLLQEAAIRHANQFDTGTRAMIKRGESWVLNRMAVAFHHYPRYEDILVVETWSSGITGFRGYREFRVTCHGNPVLTASSLWLYVDMKAKTLMRVPPEIAENFPTRSDPVFEPAIDGLASRAPTAESATSFPVSVRYSDVDSNKHVNNAAYLDWLQTALDQHDCSPTPQLVHIKFAKEIPPELGTVTVQLEKQDERTLFSIRDAGTLFAQGQVS